MRLLTAPILLLLATLVAGAAIEPQHLESKAEIKVFKRDSAEKRQDSLDIDSWIEQVEDAIGATGVSATSPNDGNNGCWEICLPFLGCQVVCSDGSGVAVSPTEEAVNPPAATTTPPAVAAPPPVPAATTTESLVLPTEIAINPVNAVGGSSGGCWEICLPFLPCQVVCT